MHPDATFVVDVKSTELYVTDPVLIGNGVKTDYWKTGHSYMKRRMHELGALAGFEKSGHYFFNAPFGRGYDDGLVSALAICDMFHRSPGNTVSDFKNALPNNGGGAQRVVMLKSGGEIVDGLDEYDEVGRTYTYRLSRENIEAFPVSFYSATLTVNAAGEGRSEIVWLGCFYRADTGNYPPDSLNDAAAIKAMTHCFHAGLEDLKAKIEGN